MQLYQHINFIYAGTLKTDNKQETNKEDYQWNHKEIVMPVHSPSWEYPVMHTPAIFNWLKKTGISADRLNRYIKAQKPFSEIQKQLISKLKQLSQTWEIVQLCFTSKFYIQKTYSNSCQHLTKRNINTLDYTYNYPKQQIYLTQLYCQNCKQKVKVDAIVKRYPNVLILNRFQDKLYLNQNEYKLYLIIIDKEKNDASIKIASGAWYQITSNGAKIKTEVQIKALKGQFYFYHRVMSQDSKVEVLKPAKQAIKQVQKPIQLQTKIESQDQKEDQDQILTSKIKQVQAIKSKPKIFITDLRPLKNQTYVPQTYSNDASYQKDIQKLYNRQKQKDNYDKQYDVGKVKKIKKKKIVHKINFNATQTQVRRGNIKPIYRKNKFRKSNLDKQ